MRLDILKLAFMGVGLCVASACMAQPSPKADSDQWGLVRHSAINLRVNPGQPSEMATQGNMGHPVKILSKDGSWYNVETSEGYHSWAEDGSIVEMTAEEMERWRQAPRLVVNSLNQIYAYDSPTEESPRHVVTDLVNGNIVLGELTGEDKVQITLPDGKKGWVKAADMATLEEWGSQPFNADRILDMAYSCLNTPYLWGGTSSKAMDCSGLSKISYLSNGRILLRDASQQATTGGRIEAEDILVECQPADLLFFGNSNGRVTHVAIYDHDGKFIHASNHVKVNSLVEGEEDFYTRPPFHAVRINGYENDRDIFQVAKHPWYFNF